MSVAYSNPVLLTAFFAELPQLIYDEGIVEEIYLDSLGFPTFGIGSLITEDDQEYGYEVGTPISEGRILQAFIDEFVFKVFPDVVYVYPDYRSMPQEAVQIAMNLLYQLGRYNYYTGPKPFKNHVAAMKRGDWKEAAAELRDSELYRRQAKKRTERRAIRLEKL